ncbi:MAG: glycoside hydrolase family 2 protein [Clostridia bacterium]|nr:glycoside hydrolase family 2 protein [Clostridia bacterium]
MRKIIDWNQDWVFIKQNEKTEINLPHTWNAVDGQDGGNDYFRGTCVYEKHFDKPEFRDGERVFIEFAGAAMTVEVRLNGTVLTRHEGGYSAFRCDLTAHLAEQNVLTVTVDNSANDKVYPQKADFTFYGGIYRDVKLIIVPAEHFELIKEGTPGIKVTPVVDLEKHSAHVKVETWQNAVAVSITIDGKTKIVPSTDGHAVAEFVIPAIHLWDGVKDPYLYSATARLESGDEISTRFGCRAFCMDPEKGFMLNGRSYPLRGVSRHQDRWEIGNALTMKEQAEDMAIVRELGANTLRLAHYQHSQDFYDLCDENGIIAWAEIPYITAHMPGGRENTLSQMREMITQCYNHPSIVCWGLSNEITVSGMSEDLIENHRLLNDLCHRMDQTRPTTMAHAFMLEHESPVLEIADVNSYNLYFGWYLGTLEQNDSFFDEYHVKFPNRPMGFSEYGADANPAFHSDAPEAGDYTEEYQCVYHEHMLKMIEERPWLWATHVWNLFDFAADGRDEGGKHGINQKGLVTFDRKVRKDAFYLYKAYWSDEPFVHICGRRFVDRIGERTQVKVYSNQSAVTLIVDGNEVDSKAGSRSFTFEIPLTGEHIVEAQAGDCRDSIRVRRVETPNAAYTFGTRGGVANWFDEAGFDSSCYSIRDSFGALSSNPETAPIVQAMMAKTRASRGEVAQSAGNNANLHKLMAGMSLESLIKKAGENVISQDDAKAINAALQKIKKV